MRKQQQQQMNVRYGGSVSPSSCIDKVDNIIDMPGKGWCFVYVARYSYDPFQVRQDIIIAYIIIGTDT